MTLQFINMWPFRSVSKRFRVQECSAEMTLQSHSAIVLEAFQGGVFKNPRVTNLTAPVSVRDDLVWIVRSIELHGIVVDPQQTEMRLANFFGVKCDQLVHVLF